MNTLSPHDYEMLSGYLDDALEARQKQKLESRLQAEPALRAELDGLRQTRRLLRSLPAPKRPRNYMLSPEKASQVKRSSGGWFSISLQWSAVISSLTVALLMASNVLVGGLLSQPMMMAAPEAEMSMMADNGDMTMAAESGLAEGEGEMGIEEFALPEATPETPLEMAPPETAPDQRGFAPEASPADAEKIPPGMGGGLDYEYQPSMLEQIAAFLANPIVQALQVGLAIVAAISIVLAIRLRR